ncbi:tol-pal system-associated acyl-CoA thioesterase [Methylomonas sp. MED-D]|uniref:4-hydroxybenzoyl-CoA thioesterase n=1 Tax=Methylomonas koyamae TaxID=702114 RepID=A0A177NE11_9GAMM|nr:MULTISPECIES: tol-pal system-associated acyl-CoA thioesterase [Methylomonas]MDT4332476.1 tol-pal system-associated acyl-CoA thioesterase [Methylomonas sp. MV1]OAI15290.1 4-hydroxybenzoyl-CoA thioesterase [Methylomonas koyamae]OHX35395.1 tol-pal system-associated acyl-CoA thioesterase [Methylomonas sp. LWB]WGS85363.1 tol-pal system-associated acyl-CoA thioesterase [Methylomonas sp. UP202]
MTLSNSAFSWPVRVYYEDTDAGGVVFYANYLKFFERARTEMLRDRGFEQDQLLREQNLIFVVRSVRVDYLKPARFNDLLQATASVVEHQKTNLTFAQTLMRGQDQLASGEIRIACLDAQTMKPKPIPLAILETLN